MISGGLEYHYARMFVFSPQQLAFNWTCRLHVEVPIQMNVRELVASSRQGFTDHGATDGSTLRRFARVIPRDRQEGTTCNAR